MRVSSTYCVLHPQFRTKMDPGSWATQLDNNHPPAARIARVYPIPPASTAHNPEEAWSQGRKGFPQCYRALARHEPTRYIVADTLEYGDEALMDIRRTSWSRRNEPVLQTITLLDFQDAVNNWGLVESSQSRLFRTF